MGEDSNPRQMSDPHESERHESLPNASPVLDARQSHGTYLKSIQIARKAVAIAMALCGAGCVICANLDPGPQTGSGSWAHRCSLWFLIGISACVAAVAVLIVEHLARPARPKPFTFRSSFVRFLLILATAIAVGDSMAYVFGTWQAIGAVAGVFLLLSAVRERERRRLLSAFFAVIVLGLTVLSTQSTYQYARRHADEIVAASRELMEKVPKTDFHPYNRHPDLDKSGSFALVGAEIQPSDPRVPSVLRKLGARRIWVDEERVAVFVGSNELDLSQFPHIEIEYQVFRTPHPDAACNPVWGFKGKGTTKITDRLWTNDY